MNVQKLDIVFDPLPPEALTRFVTESLASYNIAATGHSSWYPVSFFLRSARGEWLGGLLGNIWGGWLHVTHLWVASPERRHGNGTRLLQAAETYAIERGCLAATLETHSYEARPFYEKIGYQLFATLEDYPPGHSKFFLRKQLTSGPPERARVLLDFWFGPSGDPNRELHRPIWFKSTDEFDAALRREFLADYESAAAAKLQSWEASPEGALALLLLLDQVPRNIDQLVPSAWRLFFYMPFHHSENIADQRRSLALFNSLPRNPDRGGSLRRYGCSYIEVIERFGRFPHRNEILGRESTPAEIAFMAERERPLR
jgi:uncharacterized protein (DUF924 family)/GNAT superfamily N-acetyltransferase